MKRSNIFTAEDGTTFATAAECKKYEYIQSFNRLRDLTMEEIQSALARNDIELADAFERAGSIIATKRRESGELKRQPKNADKAPDANEAMDNIKKNMKELS